MNWWRKHGGIPLAFVGFVMGVPFDVIIFQRAGLFALVLTLLVPLAALDLALRFGRFRERRAIWEIRRNWDRRR